MAQRLWRWKPSRVSDVKYDAAGNITHYLAVCGSNATAVRNKIVGKLATGVGYAFGVNGRRCYVEAVATLSTKNKKDWKGTMCTDEGENYDLMMRTKPLVLEANGGVELGKCDRWVLYATVGAARTGNAATLARNCHDKSSRIALKLGVAGVMPTAKGDLMLEISTRHGRKSRIEARELAIEEQMSGLLAGPETQFTAKLKGYHDNHQKIECRLSWRLYL
ncbi:MAG: hypothetical protein LBB25_00545 [Holosporaceae bacterium]|nr:hypothetical protein [Holosporaceae bacterium]